MDIKRSGAQPSAKGPADWFTGTVRIDPLFSPPEPARVSGALVTFEPGARTAWHTHPLGQTLIVTAGCGRVAREGDLIEEIRPGDVVWFAPGEKHWHGAGATTAMSHIAIQEKLDGKNVDWMEKVSDEHTRAEPRHEWASGSPAQSGRPRGRRAFFQSRPADRTNRISLKATMLYGPRDVRCEEVAEPKFSNRPTPSSGFRPPAFAAPISGRSVG